MKNRFTTQIKFAGVLLATAMFVAFSTAVHGQSAGGFLRIADFPKEENLSTPKVPQKKHEAVRNYMMHEARTLKNMGYHVEMMRDGEVMVITIGASELFEPNETSLIEKGQKKLDTLLAYLKKENRFKMILVMHTDDTGSPEYLYDLSEMRLNAVSSYLKSHALYPGQIAGYAMGSSEPLFTNNTRSNRENNRRLEIYIVPDEELITNLRK